MRQAPVTFFRETENQQYNYIDLVALEISTVFTPSLIDYVQYVGFALVQISLEVSNLIDDSGYDLNESDDGWCWTIYFESGPNVGQFKKIAFRSSTLLILYNFPDFKSAVGDKIRIAKTLFLTNRNKPVDFYLPDDSNGDDEPMKYLPFPFKIKPIGTNAKNEVMSIDLTVSAVDRTISDAIQTIDGLQGSKLTHIRTFDNVLDQGKEYCIKDDAYVDSISISKEEITFELENKYIIVGVTLPGRTYTKDFCSFSFKDANCTWESGDQGFRTVLNEEGEIIFYYPHVKSTSCDHTLNGPNGCKAHNNSLRFGGFPTLVNL